jgi:O-antigen ligase
LDLSDTSTIKDRIFAIVFILLLLAFPWHNNVSSWAGVAFSALILFVPKSGFKATLQKRIHVLLVGYFLYIALPFFIVKNDDIQYSFIVDNLPFLLFPFIFDGLFSGKKGITKYNYLLLFAVGTTIGFLGCFFYAMYRFWNEFYLFLNGYIPATMLIGMHPAYFSLYVSFSFVIVLNSLLVNYPVFTQAKKFLFIAWLLLLTFGVFYIRSRTGVASFLIILVFIILYRAPKTLKILYIIAFCASVIILYVIIDKTSFHKGRFQIEQVITGIEKKQLQWQASVNVIKKNPIFGVTAIKAQRELNKQYELLEFEEGIVSRYNSHNQFLTSLIQGGIVGSLLLFLPFFLLLYRGIKTGNLVIICFFLLTSMAFFTETMLHRHKGIFFYVTILMLLGSALPDCRRNNHQVSFEK